MSTLTTAKNTLNSDVPPVLRRLAASVASQGGQAYLVGGTVRDAALAKSSQDYDIEVHGLTLPVLESILSRYSSNVNNVGASFGVLKMAVDGHDLDISLPRRDSKQNDLNSRGILATPDPYMGISEALRRRDFTINAVAYNLVSGEIIDPYDGLTDLANKRLQVVDPQTFPEDPLRVLRAAGFAARYQLSTTDFTNRVLKSTTLELGNVSKERYWSELVKLLTKAVTPSVGLELAHQVGALQVVLPEVSNLAGIPQDPHWHPEGDALVHTFKSVDAAAAVATRDSHDSDRRLLIVLTALLHDIGKAPVYVKQGDAIGHDKVGADMVKKVLSRLRAERHFSNSVTALTRLHMRGHTMDENISVSGLRRFVNDLSPASAELLADVLDADTFGRDAPGQDKLLVQAGQTRSSGSTFLLSQVEKLGPQVATSTGKQNLVTGADLLEAGLIPGRHIGKLIEQGNEMDCSKEEAVKLLVASAGPHCWPPTHRVISTKGTQVKSSVTFSR